MNNIFVGNLSFQATKEDLVKLFEPFGSVANAVIMERKKGKSRGYGFVDMPNEEEKNAAIAALQGKEFMWRALSVSPVIPKVKSASKEKKFKSAKKEWVPKEGRSIPEKTGESKYYSKFDGPPKPWRKVNKDSKPIREKDKGSRPYYGKKEKGSKPYVKDDRTSGSWTTRPSSSKPPYKKFEGQSKSSAKREEGSKFSNKPKLSKGFKMFHKVSGASKTRPKV